VSNRRLAHRVARVRGRLLAVTTAVALAVSLGVAVPQTGLAAGTSSAAAGNGSTGHIDQITNTVDARPYLRAGTNPIQVQLDSQPGNRVGRSAQSYGLTGVTFQPHVDAPIR